MNPIEQAAHELREQAQSIFECHTLNGDWRGEEFAHEEHDRLIALAEQLEAIAWQEPFGYFKAEPFGWSDCAEGDEGAIALYERPDLRVAVLEEERKSLIDEMHRLAVSAVGLERAQGVLVVALEGLLRDVQDLMAGSEGVTGLHLNGDVAPWSELEEGGRFERLLHMTAAVEALAEVKKPAPTLWAINIREAGMAILAGAELLRQHEKSTAGLAES